jgi:hypothetical protein
LTILDNTGTRELQEARERVGQLDLSRIHLNLMDKKDGPGWTADKCHAVEARYRLFLTGRLLFPTLMFAPDRDVDIFWHYHILDTWAYIVDCERLFGEYLHHNPYLGMEGKASMDELQTAWETTQVFFGLLGDVDGSPAFCGMVVPAFCGM